VTESAPIGDFSELRELLHNKKSKKDKLEFHNLTSEQENKLKELNKKLLLSLDHKKKARSAVKGVDHKRSHPSRQSIKIYHE